MLFYKKNNTQYTCFNEVSGILTHVFINKSSIDMKQSVIELDKIDLMKQGLLNNLEPSDENTFKDAYNHALSTLSNL